MQTATGLARISSRAAERFQRNPGTEKLKRNEQLGGEPELTIGESRKRQTGEGADGTEDAGK